MGPILLVILLKQPGGIQPVGTFGGALAAVQAAFDFLHLPIKEDAELTAEYQALIDKDRRELTGDFCRSCGYCMPCPAGIQINQCARMSLMLRTFVCLHNLVPFPRRFLTAGGDRFTQL